MAERLDPESVDLEVLAEHADLPEQRPDRLDPRTLSRLIASGDPLAAAALGIAAGLCLTSSKEQRGTSGI